MSGDTRFSVSTVNQTCLLFCEVKLANMANNSNTKFSSNMPNGQLAQEKKTKPSCWNLLPSKQTHIYSTIIWCAPYGFNICTTIYCASVPDKLVVSCSWVYWKTGCTGCTLGWSGWPTYSIYNCCPNNNHVSCTVSRHTYCTKQYLDTPTVLTWMFSPPPPPSMYSIY